MSAIALLTAKREEIAELCRQYGVRRLRLFGSATTDAWSEISSDIDFLAEFDDPPPGINRFKQQFGLAARLEQILGRPVDLVDWNAARNPLFREQAEQSSREWYAA